MGRKPKDPNAEANSVTLGGAFVIQIEAKELTTDMNGTVIAWEGKGKYRNPFTMQWEKLPHGVRGVKSKVIYDHEGSEKTINLNFKAWLDFLQEEAQNASAQG